MSELSSRITEPPLMQIPAGWFLMGSGEGQDVEQPIHRVWMDAFQLAATQVTVEEYRRFLDETGASPPPSWEALHLCHPRQPAVAVSWFAANQYCAWLSARTGAHYRLPTEAEWERAARGDLEAMPFPWGEELPASRPGYGSRWAKGPEQVGQSEPNAYGLYEMCENVHEWCQDWFDAAYYTISLNATLKALRPGHGSHRAGDHGGIM